MLDRVLRVVRGILLTRHALARLPDQNGKAMRVLHLSIATDDIAETIDDYSHRLGSAPCVVVTGEYALWRSKAINLSVRQDASCKPGELRHLGWENPEAAKFTSDRDVNGLLWEYFSARHQADEIEATWPGSGYGAE